MSKYRPHDFAMKPELEEELDQGLGFPTMADAARHQTRIDASDFKKELERENKKARERKRLKDGLMRMGSDHMGSQQYEWTLNLPSCTPVKGYIVVPEDVPRGDALLMEVFEKIFPSISAIYLGGTRFQFMLEGRVLGQVDLGSYELPLSVFGHQRQLSELDERQLEGSARRYLRSKLELKVEPLGEYYPPYEPRVSEKLKATLRADLRTWGGLDSPKEQTAESVGVPVDRDALNMARDGVNLSRHSSGRAMNTAFTTQSENTSKSGFRMHEAGRVIG